MRDPHLFKRLAVGLVAQAGVKGLGAALGGQVHFVVAAGSGGVFQGFDDGLADAGAAGGRCPRPGPGG